MFVADIKSTKYVDIKCHQDEIHLSHVKQETHSLRCKP